MSAVPQATRLRLEWAVMLAACLIGIAGLVLSDLTARLDAIVYDTLLSNRPRPASDRILIVALDERSLAEIGPWPWPRATQAQLIDRLAAARPRAIGYDVLLNEPRDPAGDAALAAAIGRAGNVVVPLAFTLPGANGTPVDVARPIPAVARASAAVAHVNLTPDADGVMRRAYLRYGAEGSTWTALPAAMLGRAPVPIAPGQGLQRASPVLIRYPGPADTIASVPASRMLRGEVPAELLRDKYLFVGSTAAGLGDMHAVPAAAESPLMPGVEVQAALLSSLLAPRLVTPAPRWLDWGFALGPVLVLFVGMVRLPTRVAPWLALGLIAATLLASAIALLGFDLWLAPMAGSIGVAAGYVGWAWRRLAVANAFIAQELERATNDAGDPPHPASRTGAQLDRQMALLADLTARERELRAEHDAVIRLLSHDMRAPQSAILALLEAPGADPAALTARIRSYARHTLDLADGFVHLSRAQLLVFAPEPVDLADCATVAADGLWPQAQARAIAIDVEAPEDGAVVAGERSLLTRMLTNLIDNAVKYGDAGSRVWVAVEADGTTVRACVTNVGTVITPEQQRRLFDHFDRGSRTAGDGVGLGLAFVAKVAARHGGRVTCRSEAGETCFSVDLPQTQG